MKNCAFFRCTPGIIVYTVLCLDPKPPVYKFNRLQIGEFDMSPDLSNLRTEIDMTVEAENPNRNIGISYEKDSLVAVVYKGAMLCSGQLPSFYQDRQNTTIFNVKLLGNSTFGPVLHSALEENQHAQTIPLDIYVKVPVIIRAWTTHTRELTVFVNANVVIDNLKAKKKVSIKSATYKYNVKF
ncbi:Late embryogenesis abundant protein, LEA-14 [Zostera marina]|uniref:Late embryogenesis abundant protein, LEA-14 n=1 Tax=Zostera marina TaxID=29655 RepID=A0A0K9P364_ZOSMR|nr:Late embryogenesis abundant protein, LEA-14 [Zostera marina]